LLATLHSNRAHALLRLRRGEEVRGHVPRSARGDALGLAQPPDSSSAELADCARLPQQTSQQLPPPVLSTCRPPSRRSRRTSCTPPGQSPCTGEPQDFLFAF
jgi:hypothetical protein